MKSKGRPALLVLLSFLLMVMASCQNGGSDGGAASFPPSPPPPGVHPIVINVTPHPGGGFDGMIELSDSSGPWTYPGVDAYMVNYRIKLTNVAVSADGSRVSFDIEATPGAALDMAWFTLTLSAGTTLAAGPTLVNGQGENIFVAGPLVPGTPSPMTLNITPAGTEGYELDFYFLAIDQRIAFMTDRADPGAGKPKEIFTLRPNGLDVEAATQGSLDTNANPVWSPGREWIAFERSMSVVMCGSTVGTRLQVFLAHPDGSNLRRVSLGMNYAASPNFNPSGRFMAYECKPECQPGDTIDICLHDVAAGTQKILFNGKAYGFAADQLLQPRWSPDGNYLIMRGNRASDDIVQWVYADMDPATGDSLGSPVIFIRANKTLITSLEGDTVYYRLAPRDFAWGPDSRHVVVSAIRLLSTGGAYSTEFDGLAIFDFVALIQGSTLPDVPDITKVADGSTDGSPNYPSFSADGSRLYYDRYHSSSWADLQYTPLSDYAPVTFNQKLDFLNDGHYNRTPALPAPVLPEFFPLVP